MTIKDITILSVFFIFMFYFNADGQGYKVLEVKRSFNSHGAKIKKDDFLSKNETVLIREKGYLTLDIEAPINLKLAAGRHNIDSLSTQLARAFEKHLHFEDILKHRGILECKFVYEVWIVPGTNRHYEADRITVSEENLSVKRQSADSVSLHWKNPDKKYRGSYLLIIKDAFNKLFVDVLETVEPSVTFYPGKYDHRYMLYHIVAEDCRASRTYRIEVKQ